MKLGFSSILSVAMFLCLTSKAALPFVTDDAFIQKPKQLALETFTEKWSIPTFGEKKETDVYGQYLSFSYGISHRLELTVGGMGGYQTQDSSASFMNPLLQLKAKVFEGKNFTPSVAIDFGYVYKSGVGEYFDQATNYYAITASTISLQNLQIHANLGVKSSQDIPFGSITRPHVGIAFDFSPFENKKIRFIFESYNGAPNSPRDSSGYFQSYQIGAKFVKSSGISYHILYGQQPTFAGYFNEKMEYFTTTWMQIGVRRAIF